MKVIDFFSGAGGFSEGFKQLGFDIVFALDNWGPAVDSFRWNNPETEVVKGDITKLDSKDLPEVDVIIGGPPCTSFSFANKGGQGDREEGMRLVLAFLKIVYLLKPRYWVMENVPRLLETLPEKIPLEMIGIDKGGYLHIPMRRVLLSADYGVPQKRYRLFSGDYPVPEPTHTEAGSLFAQENGLLPWMTVQDVFDILPDPLKDGRKRGPAHDPNYDLSIPRKLLTDHFYDTTLSDEEVRQNRKSKVDHSWYGKMSFPDRTDRPARTVMATQLRVSRETMVFSTESDGETKYRRPTIRECSCFQTFPITYQFVGDSEATKMKLVGNAVACKVPAAIASGILEAEDRPKEKLFLINAESMRPAPPAKQRTRLRKQASLRLRLDRGFRDHIPGSRVSGLRVDFDNAGESPSLHPLYKERTGRNHLVEWVTRLYAGSGKSTASKVIYLDAAQTALKEVIKTYGLYDEVGTMLREVEERLMDRVPDATTLQGLWAEHHNGIEATPHWLMENIADIIGSYFPEEQFAHLHIAGSALGDIINGKKVQVRTALTAFLSAYICEVINNDTSWITRNRDAAFIPQDWPEPEYKSLRKSSRRPLSMQDLLKG